MPTHAVDQVPFRLWAPARFRAFVSVVAAAAAGLVPVFALQPAPAYADPGDIIIEADIEGSEGGEFAFEVQRLGPITGSVTYKYDIIPAPGDGFEAATAGTDYTAISGQATFTTSNRTSIRRIVVNGIADPNDEFDERFALRLRYLDDTLVTPIAYGTMLDDDAPPTYSLDTSPLTVAEDAGNATITATLSNFSAKEVRIPYATTAGTATADSDYTTTTGTLVIPAESPTGTITVPIANDTRDEVSPEDFTVGTTGSLTNVTAGSPVTTTVNITDNDSPPQVYLEEPADVAEGDPIIFPVKLDAASNRDVTVNATFSGGSGAAPDDDYTVTSPQTVTIPAGQTTTNVTVPTVGDAVVESGESVDLTISAPANATLGGGVATTSVGIIDTAVTVASDAAIVEGAGGTTNQTFTVTLNKARQTSTVVDYTVTGDSATAGTDFDTVAPGTLTFAPGETTKTITVVTHGDTIYEAGGETFTIALTPSESSVGVTGTGQFTIPEDDATPALLGLSSVPRTETDSGTTTATFVASIDHASAQDIILDVAVSNAGTTEAAGASPGDDDFDLAAATLTILAGSTTGEVDVTVKGDEVYETDETATITATRQDGGATGGPVSGTLTIENDDTVPTISLGSLSQPEGTDSVALAATVDGEAEGALTFTASAVGASDGSSNAAEAEDFVSGVTASGQLDPGDPTLDFGTIDLATDQVDEFAETIRISATMDGSTVSDYVTITDDTNDLGPIVSIDPTGTVAENAGPALVPVTLDYDHDGNDATETEKTIDVAYGATAGGSANASDFTVGTGTVSFTGSELSKNISVNVTTDEVYELAETFNVDLTGATNAASVDTGADNSVVTITNDDTAPAFTVTPDATSTPLEVAEDGTATFTVTLGAPALAPVDFTVVMGDGSTTGGDYTAHAGTFTIGTGNSTATVDVPIVDDAVDEAAETATVTIDRAFGETDASGGPVVSTISITDNDDAPTATLTPIAGAEGDVEAVSASVVGSSQASIPWTATVTGVGGTAAVPGLTNAVQDADVDGTGLTLSGSLAPGGSSINLGNLGLEDDAIDEADQQAQVSITLGSQDAVTTTVTIADNADDLGPQVSIAPTASVAENAGPALVPVTLDYDHDGNDATETEKTIDVAYAATAGGSAAAADFT
ncbi:Calx-beta domain-containing protein, partial [Actinoplanes sp. GCM10030250]|uniref:Calx-beta domain-containing protein n=1 Tax=Actinoplanes sp. GCM10030250 TaxID=3273376 RepID=UPI003608B439